MCSKKDIKYVLVYAAFALLSTRTDLMQQGTIGLRHDWDIPAYRWQLIHNLVSSFSSWDGISGNPIIYPTLNYFKVFEASIVVIAGGSGALLSKFLVVILLFLAGLAMYRWTRLIGLQRLSSFLAGSFYMLSPLLYNKVIAGHYLYLFSTALSPFVLSQFHRGTSAGRLRWSHILTAGFLYGVAWAQFQFAFLLPMVLVVSSLFLNRHKVDHGRLPARNLIIPLIVVLSIGGLMQFYWILPYLLVPDSSVSLGDVAPLTYYEIVHAPTMLEGFGSVGYPHPYDYTERGSVMIPQAYYLLLYAPVIGGLTALFTRKHERITLMAVTILTAGLFLVTSVNGPFDGLWSWLYLHIPLLRIFREVYHFMFLVTFAVALLIGTSFDIAIERLRGRKKQLGAFLLGTMLIIGMGAPVLSGSFLHQTQTYEYPNGTQQASRYLADQQQYRALWLPSISPISYHNTEYSGTDTAITDSPVPTFSQTVDRTDPLDRYGDLLTLLLRKNDHRAQSLFGPASIRELVVRPDVKSDYVSFMDSTREQREAWAVNFPRVLAKLRDVKRVHRYHNVSIYRTTNVRPYVHASQRPVLVYGNLLTVAKLNHYPENAIVFSSAIPSRSELTNSGSNTMVFDGETPPPSLLSGDARIVAMITDKTSVGKEWATESAGWWQQPDVAALPPNQGARTVMTSAYDELPNRIPPDKRKLVRSWTFDRSDDGKGWDAATEDIQFDARQRLRVRHGSLRASLYDSTQGWKIIRSPAVEVTRDHPYRLSFDIEGQNTYQTHVKVLELNGAKKPVHRERIATIDRRNFSRQSVSANYHVKNPDTKYIRLEIWHGERTPRPLPSSIRLDNVSIWDVSGAAKPVAIDRTFQLQNAGRYDVYVRHLQHPNGGTLTATIDGKRRTIPTTGNSNRFVWSKVGTTTLKRGSHHVGLVNEFGSNAVSSFAVVPTDRKSSGEAQRLLQNKNIVNIYEAESDFGTMKNVSVKPNPSASNYSDVTVPIDGKLGRQVRVLRNDTYLLSIRGRGKYQVTIDKKTFHVAAHRYRSRTVRLHLSRGVHHLSIRPRGRLVKRIGFESHRVDASPIDNYSVRRVKYGPTGTSLRVKTRSRIRQWSSIRTRDIDVTPGKAYTITTHMKYRNVQQSHVAVEGYNENTGRWKQLVQVPTGQDGTHGWKQYRSAVQVPPNVSRLRFSLNAGWVNHPGNPGTTWFDNLTVHEKREYRLDAVRLYTSQSNESLAKILSPNNDVDVLGYRKVNPGKYKVRVKASSPYFLTLAEGYHPGWEAVVRDGTSKRYESILTYGAINGFRINKTGKYTVILRYRPQLWFYRGGVVSILTVLIVLAGALYYRRSEKRP